MSVIIEKSFKLATPDGSVQIGWVYEQQVRSLKGVIPELEVVATRSDTDFGRTAQRDREAREEAAAKAARYDSLPGREQVDA